MKIFIPIKHVSQRVPRKNFRIFKGEPLFKHTLLKFVDCEVYVNTDSLEIKNSLNSDSRFNNVKILDRKKELQGHEVSVCDLIEDFITTFKIEEPIVQTHVTSPYLKRQTIDKAYSLIGNHDSVVSCNTHQSRFWRKEDYGFCPVNHNPIDMKQTQDLPKFYEENSTFYIFNSTDFMITKTRVGKNPFFYELKNPENLDIDTEDDWERCIKFLNLPHGN